MFATIVPLSALLSGTALLLLHGLGAAFGPALAVRRRDTYGEAHFHPMLRTSPTAMEMLPEADASKESAG